jgi:putative aminopeptidase FrvX
MARRSAKDAPGMTPAAQEFVSGEKPAREQEEQPKADEASDQAAQPAVPLVMVSGRVPADLADWIEDYAHRQKMKYRRAIPPPGEPVSKQAILAAALAAYRAQIERD